MPKHVAASNHVRRHRFTDLSVRLLVLKSKEIYADASGCMQLQASAPMFILFCVPPRAEKKGIHANAGGRTQPHASL